MLALAMVVGVVACGEETSEEPRTLAKFGAMLTPDSDAEPQVTRRELASRSSDVVMATLIAVDGLVPLEQPDGESAASQPLGYVELVFDSADLPAPIHILRPIADVAEVSAIRDQAPMGVRALVFVIPADLSSRDQLLWGHLEDIDGNNGHDHYWLTAPQGLIFEQPDGTAVPLWDSQYSFSDPPQSELTLEAWAP